MSQRVLITEYLQSSLGPDSDSAYEVTYYLWRRKRRPGLVTGRRLGGYSYEIWVVATPGRKPDGEPSAEPDSGPGGRLKEAIADVAADRVMGAVWKIDGLSEGTAATLVEMPGKLQGLVNGPLSDAAGAVLPDPLGSFSGEVAGTLLLKPVMGPVGDVLHGLEIVGVVAGFVTCQLGLSALCLKHLAHDKITRLLGKAFNQAIRGVDKTPDRQQSPAAGPEAVGRLTRPATASRTPTTSKATRVSADLGIPQGRSMRRTGRPPGSDADGSWEHPARTVASEETAKRLRSARSLHHPPAAARAPVDTMSGLPAEPPLPAGPPLPADPPTLSNSPSAPDSRPGRITGMSR